jgi:hypothetical protein
MPKENHRACKVQKAGEISSVPLIPGDESPRVLQPGKEAFDFPAAFIAAQGTSILREVDSVRPMRRDELDATRGERLIEAITVIRGVPNQPLRIVREKAGVQRLLDELRFVRRGRGDGNGERKTSAVCNGHDLGPLAALRFADMPAFFLALAKEPSMNVSVRSSPPRAWRSAASALRSRRSVPSRTQR